MDLNNKNNDIFDNGINLNKKRIKSKQDWIDILNNEEQEDNVILDILHYMINCKEYTSNGLKIQKCLNLNGIPNLDIKRFGERIVKLKKIPDQFRANGQRIYWNIPFETVIEKNTNLIFTWKIRKELADALIEKYNLTLEHSTLEDLVIDFKEELSEKEFNKIIKKEIDLRDKFVKKFTLEQIKKLSLEEFVTGRSKIDNQGQNSFCYLLESKLTHLGELRGPSAIKFGVYFTKYNKYKYAKKYGISLNNAFENIKKEICELLKAAENDDFDKMDKSLISPMFKGKILSVYYPDKYLSILNEVDIDKFLYYLDVPYDNEKICTTEMKKIVLKKFKENNRYLKNMNDYYFMRFLYYSFKKELKIKTTVPGFINSNLEKVEFKYIGPHKTNVKEKYRSRETNYEKINRVKKETGLKGEKAVLEFEKNKLIKLGYYDLVEYVQQCDNDAQGYDIISFDENRNEIHIEVKTNSSSNKNTMDFYLTNREYIKLCEEPNYYIYYLFDIKTKPKYHIVNKKELLKNKDYLKPVVYKISVDII